MVEFENLNGEPIAIFINFAAHATVFNAGGSSSGYIPDDGTYDMHTYQSTTTRIKRECAESGIVGGILDLMDIYKTMK